MIRSALVVASLGISSAGDAAAAALRIPNVMQNLLGEGALSAAFIPSYARLSETDEREAGLVAGAVASFLLALSGLGVAVAVLGARPLTRLIAPGFSGARFELTVDLVRIFAGSAGVLVLSAWCLGILNSHGRFFLSYVAPAVWNGAQIATLVAVGLLGWSTVDTAHALAWSALAGAVLQVGVQWPSVRRACAQLRLNVQWRRGEASAVLRRFGPAVAGRGALQLSAFIDLALASLLAAGATAALAAAQPLYILPISLIAVSRSAVELPDLSREASADVMVDRTRMQVALTGHIIAAVVVAYLSAGDLVVSAIYQLGGLSDRVSDDSVIVIAIVLGTFAVGLPALTASRLWQNVLFAQGDTRTPSKIAFVRIAVSFLVGIVTMFQLDRLLIFDGGLSGLTDLLAPFGMLPDAIRENDDLPVRLGVVGLALGASIGAWVEYLLIQRALRYASGPVASPRPHRTLAATAAIAATLLIRWALPPLPVLLELPLFTGTSVVIFHTIAERAGAPGAARARRSLFSRLVRPR